MLFAERRDEPLSGMGTSDLAASDSNCTAPQLHTFDGSVMAACWEHEEFHVQDKAAMSRRCTGHVLDMTADMAGTYPH